MNRYLQLTLAAGLAVLFDAALASARSQLAEATASRRDAAREVEEAVAAAAAVRAADAAAADVANARAALPRVASGEGTADALCRAAVALGLVGVGLITLFSATDQSGKMPSVWRSPATRAMSSPRARRPASNSRTRVSLWPWPLSPARPTTSPG